jgi:hypothetical protein
MTQGEQRKVCWRGKHYNLRDMRSEPIHGTSFHSFCMDNRTIRRSFLNNASPTQFIKSTKFQKLL